MSNERDMRKEVVAALRELDAVSIENGVGIGTPDVNYVGGWLELKHLDAWPERASTVVECDLFTPQQRVFILRRVRAGGRADVLLKVGRTRPDWVLLPGAWAAQHLGSEPRRVLVDNCLGAWCGRLVGEELVACLKRT